MKNPSDDRPFVQKAMSFVDLSSASCAAWVYDAGHA
jgi:hypothetical protein